MSSGKYRKESNCLNCNQTVAAHFCSHCGQENLELKENIWSFLSHSIGHYFHFDNKFFHTLKPLLFKPGQVTIDYLAGRRARYINPVSIYIFVSIVYFLIVPHKNRIEQVGSVKTLEAVREYNKIIKDAPFEYFGQIGDWFVLSFLNDDFEKLNFSDQAALINELKNQNIVMKSDSLSQIISSYESSHLIKRDSTYKAYTIRQNLLPAAQKDHWFARTSKKREIELNIKAKNENWSIYDQVEYYRPKQFFLLMPLLAMFFLWIFRKNKFYYIDHLIFTIHCMSAFFIFQIATIPIRNYIFGLDSTVSDLINYAVFCLIIFYVYKGIRLFYNRPRWQSIRKMFALACLFAVAFIFSEWLVQMYIFYFQH